MFLQKGYLLPFISKTLASWSQGMYAYAKDTFMVVDQCHHYLLQSEIVIHTDHHSLIHLNEQHLHTPYQLKVFTTLLGLRYRVVSCHGVEN